MDKKTKEELGEFFAESFREVVLPELEDIRENMATKEDIHDLKMQLIKRDERMDRHGKTLENHEKRIKKVESKISIAST